MHQTKFNKQEILLYLRTFYDIMTDKM